MKHKCCRLAYLLPQWKIDNVFKVHGDIEVWDNTGRDPDNPEPEHGWIMNKPQEGYPCYLLTPDGCGFELSGFEKPFRCRNFPIQEQELHLIDTCGFKFVNGKREGSCDGCKKSGYNEVRL